MSADGGNRTLPDGWRRVRLGDVLELRNGRAFKPGEWKVAGRPIIRIQNLKSGGATFNYFDGDLPDRFAARPGDLLFAWSGTPGTSFGAHVWEGPDAWINQHIFRVDFSSDLFDRDFLKSALNMNLSSYIEQAQGGVGLAHITKAKLNESELLAPPIAEQRRIVERLDKVEERRSAIAAHLEAARATLERVRSSVLSAASSGRLTEDWRESRGLPDWPLMPAQEVCDKVQSGTTPKRWHTGDDGVPFLKVYNVVDQQLSFAPRPQYIAPDLHKGAMRRATALPGDVLMNIVGPPLGKVAVVTDEYPEWSINQALTLFRPSERVTTDWLYIFLCSGTSLREVFDATRGTVGQVNISLTQCRNFDIPLPEVDEQREVARRVRAILALADRVATNVQDADRMLDHVSRASFARAFRGELVRTDASLAVEDGRNFEPAEELRSRVLSPKAVSA